MERISFKNDTFNWEDEEVNWNLEQDYISERKYSDSEISSGALSSNNMDKMCDSPLKLLKGKVKSAHKDRFIEDLEIIQLRTRRNTTRKGSEQIKSPWSCDSPKFTKIWQLPHRHTLAPRVGQDIKFLLQEIVKQRKESDLASNEACESGPDAWDENQSLENLDKNCVDSPSFITMNDVEPKIPYSN